MSDLMSIVIGAGPAGTIMAAALADRGLRVADWQPALAPSLAELPMGFGGMS